MKSISILFLAVIRLHAVDVVQPANEITTDGIKKYASETWCGGMISRYSIGGNAVLVLDMDRTSGIASSELYVYKAINTNLWLQFAHLPLVAMATRKVVVEGDKLIITEMAQNGTIKSTQDIVIK